MAPENNVRVGAHATIEHNVFDDYVLKLMLHLPGANELIEVWGPSQYKDVTLPV